MLLLAPAIAHAQPLPDPTERTAMQRTGGNATTRTAWVLQSTLIAEDRRVAVINGETVTVGDRVQGAVVLGIEPFAVRLRAADGIVVITLTDGDPKQVASGGTE
jgi:hypothetical protein